MEWRQAALVRIRVEIVDAQVAAGGNAISPGMKVAKRVFLTVTTIDEKQAQMEIRQVPACLAGVADDRDYPIRQPGTPNCPHEGSERVDDAQVFLIELGVEILLSWLLLGRTVMVVHRDQWMHPRNPAALGQEQRRLTAVASNLQTRASR